MTVLAEIGRLASAEEFFEYLDVPYDPAVVRVARLHILRRMGQYLKQSDADDRFSGVSDQEIRLICRAHLDQAYQDFVKSSPIQERIFKVHKDAVQPKPEPVKPFVSLESLTLVAK